MKKLLLMAAAVFVCGATASAQFTGGSSSSSSYSGNADKFSAGWVSYAPTTFKYAEDGSTTSTDDFKTVSAGYTITAPLSNFSLPLWYEYGFFVDYTWWSKTYKEDGVTVKNTWNMAGLKIPLNILYPLALSPDITVYPYAGLNAKIYAFGQRKYTVTYDGDSTSNSANIFSSDDMGDDKAKRFGVGYQVGLRVGYSKYFASISYEAGLTDFQDHTKVNLTNISIGIQF